MHPFRTVFANEIVAEFLPPARKSRKVMILLGGMPTVPAKREMLVHFSKRGYWTFFPRYRGSWESGGRFLRISPERDVLDLVGQLPRGFKDMWSRVRHRIVPSVIHIIASSFGGPAGILASRDPRVSKVVALSPVVDWRAPSAEEPLGRLYTFVKEAFGGGYRVSRPAWDKLERGMFYNPAAHVSELNGRKLFIIHASDDRIVRPGPVIRFAKKTGASFLLLPRGGHLGSRTLFRPSVHKRMIHFFRT